MMKNCPVYLELRFRLLCGVGSRSCKEGALEAEVSDANFPRNFRPN